jgi:hypothetical protein
MPNNSNISFQTAAGKHCSSCRNLETGRRSGRVAPERSEVPATQIKVQEWMVWRYRIDAANGARKSYLKADERAQKRGAARFACSGSFTLLAKVTHSKIDKNGKHSHKIFARGMKFKLKPLGPKW